MNVITTLYNLVLARTTEEQTVKRFEWYSGELEQENKEDYALMYDSCYMEYDPITWESLGNKRQAGMCNFRLFVCSPAVHGSGSNELPATRSAELEHLERLNIIYKKLHCYAGGPDDGVGCISRTESNVRIKYPGLLVDILSFKVRLTDDVAKHTLSPLPEGTVDEISTQKFINNTQSMYKAWYLDGFDAICGNPTKENTLLAFLKSRGVNTVYAYDLSTILATTGGYPLLAAFVIKARTYGITKVYGFRGSDTTITSAQVRSNKSYNLAHPEAKIHSSLEDEFFNYTPAMVGTVVHYATKLAFPVTGQADYTYVDDSIPNDSPTALQKYWLWIDGAYVKLVSQSELMDVPDAVGNVVWRNWLLQQQAIRTYSQGAGLENDFYIGHVKDPVEGTATATIAAGLVGYTNRIHVSCYLTTANFNKVDGGFKNIKTRLGQLGAAALLQSKRMDVVVIFANTNEFMKSYFDTKTPQSAYDKVVASFAKASFTGKAGVRLAGWNVYKLPIL